MHMLGSNVSILAKLLLLLLNLETLEVFAEDCKEPDFDISFKPVTLPQIRKLLVSTGALRHEVLPQCQEPCRNPPAKIRRHLSEIHPFRRWLSDASRAMSSCA